VAIIAAPGEGRAPGRRQMADLWLCFRASRKREGGRHSTEAASRVPRRLTADGRILQAIEGVEAGDRQVIRASRKVIRRQFHCE
jgi:hypothetical protein